jgi:hypothetical protein
VNLADVPDVTVPTSGIGGLIAAIATPKVIGTVGALLLVGWVVRRIWEAIPKGVLMVGMLLLLLVTGALVVHGVHR